jgi:hypothetical protein
MQMQAESLSLAAIRCEHLAGRGHTARVNISPRCSAWPKVVGSLWNLPNTQPDKFQTGMTHYRRCCAQGIASGRERGSIITSLSYHSCILMQLVII